MTATLAHRRGRERRGHRDVRRATPSRSGWPASSCPGCRTRTVTHFSAAWPATPSTGYRRATASGPGAQAMYALANRIAPEDLQVLATQLFVEMLKAGYTSVAEFHYLHRQTDGEPYPARMACGKPSAAAAEATGIGSDASADPLSDQRLRRAAAKARAGAFRDGDRLVRAGDRRSVRRGAALGRRDPPHRSRLS